MKLKSKKHALTEVWDSYPEIFSKGATQLQPTVIEKIISDVLAVGPFYYYTVNLSNSRISNCSKNILPIHGLSSLPKHLSDVIALIHPDDISHVTESERRCIEKIKEIGIEKTVNLKVSYCFRMRVADGTYQLFHHQSLQSLIDSDNRILKSINIHTNIHHISPINHYIVTITGIGGLDFFVQINLDTKPNLINQPHHLTKRELEILRLIANGCSAMDIANNFFISVHTVKTHKRNILRKTETKNSTELVKKCIEWGLL